MRPSASPRAWLLSLGLAALTLAIAVRLATHVSERPRWLVPGLALISATLVIAAGSVPRRDP